jgi:hypothetical protein
MLNAKVFNLFVTWFISTIMLVALTPENVEGQEPRKSVLGADETSSVLVAQLQEELDAFFSSKYTYCDAQRLSEYWGQSVVDAKVRIGQKILWGDRGVAYLEQYLVDAQAQALFQDIRNLCLFSEQGYTYDDAVALSKFWGDPSPWDAKIRIERNLILGNDEIVQEALRLATIQ